MKARLGLLLMSPSLAAAAEGVLPAPGVGEVAVSLGGVIVVIMLLAWGIRRLQTGSPAGSNGGIRIITALPVGARDRIVVLEVGEQQLLVGMSPGRMQTLHVLPKPLDSHAGRPQIASFAARLKEVMSRRGQ